MKILKLCPFLLSVTLLGCNTPTQTISEPQVIAIEKNVQNDTVLAKSTNTKANSKSTVKKNTVKKTTPAIPQVPTVNKTTVKDVIVDGTGSLVFAKADGTFLSFAPVQSQRGEQGAKGDKGDRGEQGANGRGIDHCELDADKNLIVYYTDGTSQNVGCVAITQENNNSEFLFSDGGNGTTLLAYNGNSYSVTIPSKCTEISSKVFMDKSFITSISIPNGVTSIGAEAFSRCQGLSSITIPDSVTHIGDSAFSGCNNLTSVNIPNGVESILNNTFDHCANLTSVNIPDGIITIGASAFIGCGLTSINIPNSVRYIQDSAFCDTLLTSVNLPNGVESIEDCTFMTCFYLTTVNIPDSVTNIGDYAFWGCTNLNSVNYKNNSYTEHTSLITALRDNGVTVSDTSFNF